MIIRYLYSGITQCCLCIVILFNLVFINAAIALSYDQITAVYFFGDSLSDAGFYNSILVPVPLHKTHNFTTYGGHTWAEYVAHDIKGAVLTDFPNVQNTMTNNYIYNAVPKDTVIGVLNFFNYAAGGSTTNSAGFAIAYAPPLLTAPFSDGYPHPGQIDFYLTQQAVDPKAVYFIWSGSNDMFTAMNPTSGPFPEFHQLIQTADIATTNIALAATRLLEQGARRLVIVGFPNFGAIPSTRIKAQILNRPDLLPEMQNVSYFFNQMLNKKIAELNTKFNTNILFIDIYTIMNDLIQSVINGTDYTISGQSFHFTNYTDPTCLETPPNSNLPNALFCAESDNVARPNYVFADDLHPTDAMHRILSLQVEQQILQWNVQ